MAPSTMYDRVGGDAFFEELTTRFYLAVRTDPVLRPLYPADEAALEEARVHLREFLVQFWGGPDRYSRLRGRPQLRWRHAPFAIGPDERDAWAHHMTAAVRAGGLRPMDEQQMVGYFEAAATAMINDTDRARAAPTEEPPG